MIRTTFVPATRTAPSALRPLPAPLLLPPLAVPVPAPAAAAPPAAVRRTPLQPLRLLTAFVTAMLTGAVVAVALGFVASTALGYHHFTVMSGSMEPTISPGDVVVDATIAPVTARVGDIVTFPDPAEKKRLISHRVTAMHVADGTVYFTTKGDANNAVQKWTAPVHGSIGRVTLVLPKVGYGLFWLGRRWGRLGLVVLPLLVLGGYELRSIWRTGDGEPAPSPRRGHAAARHARR